MRRFVSVWDMPRGLRKAFTLIEVMVAVMIVSVVIATLLKMQGESSHKLGNIKAMLQGAPYSSLLLYTPNRLGFESSSTNLKELLSDFDVESNLKRKLASAKASLEYEELERLDMSELDENASGLVFEVGISKFESQNFENSLVRIRMP